MLSASQEQVRAQPALVAWLRAWIATAAQECLPEAEPSFHGLAVAFSWLGTPRAMALPAFGPPCSISAPPVPVAVAHGAGSKSSTPLARAGALPTLCLLGLRRGVRCLAGL